MIVASIDIGTNTVLLLIAEVDIKTKKLIPLKNEYRLPRIGHDTIRTGIIKSEKINSLFEVLDEYVSIIDKYKCERVIVIGTNALRIAKNSGEISSKIHDRYNFTLQIIPGGLEAEYAYLGAISGMKNVSSAMVIDIGGGSTELIFGSNSGIINKRSIQIGSVSATENFLKHSPPLHNEIQLLTENIYSMLTTEFSKETKVPDTVVAVAGTATTLGCMKLNLKEFEENQVEGSQLSMEELNDITNKLSQSTPDKILEQYGQVMKGREDIILAGAIILQKIMEYFNIEELTVSSRGIRYGAIIHWLNSLNQS